MAEEKDEQQAVGELARIAEEIKALKSKKYENAEDREKLDRLEEAVSRISKTMGTAQAKRKGEFSTEDVDRMFATKKSMPGGGALKALHKLESKDPEVRAVQEALDGAYILGKLLNVRPDSTEYWKDAIDRIPLLKKSLDTTAGGEGTLAGWIPTDMSAALHEKVRLSLRVAALHTRINMPTTPYKLPIEGADARAYLVTEQGDSDAYLTAGNAVTPSYSGGDSPGMINMTLEAQKIGARVTTSAELTEESIIPILPYLVEKLARSMAEAQEECTVNGKREPAVHMDSGVSGADRRRAWDGYRALTTSGCKIAVASTDLSVANLRALRQTMGKYSVNPADCVIVTGPVGFNKLLSLKDGNNPSPVLTVEKYGPQATLVTGELARIDGMPIILSEFVREDLNQQGNYDGVTTTSTLLFMVHRRQFVYGDYRRTTLESRRIIETDQTTLVTMQRLDFRCWFPTEPVVGYLYDIRK